MVELTLSGPGKNALGTVLMEQLRATLRTARDQPLLVRGSGDAFSAGLDLKEVASLDRTGMERFLGTLEELVDALYNHPAPTVACINVHAIAGGCVIALCCDHRVAADTPTIRIGLNEVALGLEFPPKVLGVARRRIPPRSLERVLLEAGLYEPRTALELGLVDEVAADAPAAARAHLERLATHPRETYTATKRALRAGTLDLDEAALRRFRTELVPAWCAPAVKERVRAALARRR